MSEKIIIFDTTLRDGDQSLDASLNIKDKLTIALALEKLKVDIIEAGFPISSPGDFEAVQLISNRIKNSKVCALARAVPKDIEVAAKALYSAENKRIHTFISTSDIHIKEKLKSSFEKIEETAVRAIKLARNFTDDVEFSCEDAGRTSLDNLCRIVEKAIHAGASTINIADTVGYTLPNEFQNIISSLFLKVPNIHKAIISVHCHDDLGLSVANSISAVQAGARQVECTINGIGERAGNCALEEVVMAIKARAKDLKVHTDLNFKEITKTSQLVSQLCNMPIQPNKAIVGENAFSHSSGIHQDGILKNKKTYEIITPESIGLLDKSLNLTSRSGRAAIKERIASMGYEDSDYNLDNLYESFLKLADKKGKVYDYDLEALIYFTNTKDNDDFYNLEYINVQSGNKMATASITLKCGSEIKSDAAVGNGPVDALYHCFYKVTGYDIQLDKFHLKSTGEGENSLGKIDIIANFKGRSFHGTGLATDIVEAAGQALLHVINTIYRAEKIDYIKRSVG
ncbi:2-isopropylmalate synthase [Paraphotobacterium marinum]|uniref:2-isopropylmalate synthase n=1 Tax=Paraphotobacterium marinum TaxID=1755811 RepID=A0A220VD77_9GAMM|nr:2-isopropylmalate synthase [Paraphotobacterium marinum]ASK78299.1 2-isopropylmalate synthase [Paraphotobacterium marinum]